jgi:hypothetical protein
VTHARANNLTNHARALARRSTYMTDRNHDLRAVMLAQLEVDLPIPESDLIDDFPQSARDEGIAENRIAAASPRGLLLELETAGLAERRRLSVNPGEPLRTHWSKLLRPGHPSKVARAVARPPIDVQAARRELQECRVTHRELEQKLEANKRRITDIEKRLTRAGVPKP